MIQGPDIQRLRTELNSAFEKELKRLQEKIDRANKALKQLEIEHRATLKGLERLQKAGTGSSASDPALLRQTVLAAAREVSPISTPLVVVWIEANEPALLGPNLRPAVAKMLARLADEEVLKIVRQGAGRRPALFGLAESSNGHGDDNEPCSSSEEQTEEEGSLEDPLPF